MDVYNAIIKNTSLNGMPKWFKATSLLLFAAILSLIFAAYLFLILQGTEQVIRFGY